MSEPCHFLVGVQEVGAGAVASPPLQSSEQNLRYRADVKVMENHIQMTSSAGLQQINSVATSKAAANRLALLCDLDHDAAKPRLVGVTADAVDVANVGMVGFLRVHVLRNIASA